MKILVATSLISPYRADWFNELAKYADVKILYLYDTDGERKKEWLAKKPDKCECKKMKSIRFPLVGALSFEFIKEYKKHGDEYDVIVLDGYGFLTQIVNIFYLKRRKKKFYVNVDGALSKEKEKPMQRAFKRKIIASVPYFLCGSKVTNDYLVGYGAKPENIFNHPFTSLYERDILSVPPSSEEKARLRETTGMTERHAIISVGRFSYLKGYGKGYDVLLRAAKRLGADYGFYIIGDEPTEEFIKLKNESGLDNVHFIGFKNKKELKDYYLAADVFVLMTVYDVWGLVVNEAMANGLPVITSDKCVAGLQLIENGKNGYVVPVGDDKTLSERLESLFSDPNLLSRMAQASIETIKPYTIENMAKTHYDVFKSEEK